MLTTLETFQTTPSDWRDQQLIREHVSSSRISNRFKGAQLIGKIVCPEVLASSCAYDLSGKLDHLARTFNECFKRTARKAVRKRLGTTQLETNYLVEKYLKYRRQLETKSSSDDEWNADTETTSFQHEHLSPLVERMDIDDAGPSTSRKHGYDATMELSQRLNQMQIESGSKDRALQSVVQPQALMEPVAGPSRGHLNKEIMNLLATKRKALEEECCKMASTLTGSRHKFAKRKKARLMKEEEDEEISDDEFQEEENEDEYIDENLIEEGDFVDEENETMGDRECFDDEETEDDYEASEGTTDDDVFADDEEQEMSSTKPKHRRVRVSGSRIRYMSPDQEYVVRGYTSSTESSEENAALIKNNSNQKRYRKPKKH